MVVMLPSTPNIYIIIYVINSVQIDARRLFLHNVARFAVRIPHLCHRIIDEAKTQNKSMASREMPSTRTYSENVVQKFLDFPDKRFENLFRMPKHTFLELLVWLEKNEGLEHTKHFTAEHQLMVFLWILGHGQHKSTLPRCLQ